MNYESLALLIEKNATVSSELTVAKKIFSKVMEFFDRDKEITFLRRVRDLSTHSAQFTVITGRRRIGKTSLVLKAYGEPSVIYFFVARKTEVELCQDFAQELESKLGIPMMGTPEVCHDIRIFDETLALTSFNPLY